MAGLIYQSRFVLPIREFEGAVDQLTALNARLLPNSIVLISEPAESALADNFGVPLRFMFNHDVAAIRTDDAATGEFLDRLLARAAAEQRPVQLIAANPIAPTMRSRLHLQPRDVFEIRLHALMSTFYDYPSVDQPAYYGWEIYDVTGPRAALTATLPLTIDVGTLDATVYPFGLSGQRGAARWRVGALDAGGGQRRSAGGRGRSAHAHGARINLPTGDNVGCPRQCLVGRSADR